MFLARIVIFPIKSLDGVEIKEASITPGGILENDRIFAILDSEGRYVNGKRTARVHQLRSLFGPEMKDVRFWEEGQSSPTQFALNDSAPINRWLSDFFGFAVTLAHDPRNGFPDDRTAFGPTVTSEASLKTIQEWYPELTLESVRRRFRANLELGGGEPFCEDGLYGAPDELKPFELGTVRFVGHNPCQRCVVPTRNPENGDPIAGFQKKFMELRQQHLPQWANAQRFNHFYRFAVNTSIPESEAGKLLRLGDVLVAH